MSSYNLVDWHESLLALADLNNLRVIINVY